MRLFKFFPRIAAFFAVLMLFAGQSANSACLTLNNTQLTIRFPDYPFWRIVADEMQQCGNVNAVFDFDAAAVVVDPNAPDKDLGSLVGVSNASLYRLSKQRLLRPLDNLVEKYKDKLAERQLIRIDGKVVAIAVAANTRALMVHQGLFTQEKIEIPKTYEQFFIAADKLKGSELYQNSFSLAFKSGWNLTQEFLDQYLAGGGKWLDEENQPLVSGEIGISTLERMKRLSTYLRKDFAEADSAAVLEDLLKFNAPMSVLWTSSAGPLDNPTVSRVAGKMSVLPAPAIVSGGKPASTLWWDGFAIPVSVTDEEAEAALVTALEGLDAQMLEMHRDDAFWLLKDYVPTRLTKDVLDAINKDGGQGINYYPAGEASDLLRRALGPLIADFMEGKIEAAAALGQAEADYMRAARERGLVGS